MTKSVRRNIKKDRQNKRNRRIQEGENTYQPFEPTPVRRKQLSPISAKTENQGQYVCQILSKDIVFGIGPAGTGKTYLSAGLACEALEAGECQNIIITRPMQGCDEEMGFLPGEQDEKYAPWVEPVMDVLEKRLGKSNVAGMIKAGRIQWKPLQYMRGKSFDDCWVIMDEAQNVTPSQMKMFLTRIGEGSKLIINGDLRQSDLTDRRGNALESGLSDAIRRLQSLPEVGLVEFTRDDIVRHGIIRKILDRYED